MMSTTRDAGSKKLCLGSQVDGHPVIAPKRALSQEKQPPLSSKPKRTQIRPAHLACQIKKPRYENNKSQIHKATKRESGNVSVIQAPRVRLLDQPLHKVAIASVHLTDKVNSEAPYCTTGRV
jgi:hypothetical protein